MTAAKLLVLLASVLLLLGAAATVGWAVGSSADRKTKELVVRQPLAQSKRVQGAKGKTLGLTRIVVKPGAELALHHHPGTQIAYVARGTLTYSVDNGSATVRRGPADQGARLVRRIRAGQTAKLRKGQWIVEQSRMHHHAANKGNERVVLYLATLFRAGAPPAVPG